MSVDCELSPLTLDLLVILVCFDVYSRTASKTGSPGGSFFDVYSRTASKTGSPGRSFFSNCLPVHRIDAIIFQVSFYDIFVSSLGRPTGRLPPVNSPYIICLGRRSMGIRCT